MQHMLVLPLQISWDCMSPSKRMKRENWIFLPALCFVPLSRLMGAGWSLVWSVGGSFPPSSVQPCVSSEYTSSQCSSARLRSMSGLICFSLCSRPLVGRRFATGCSLALVGSVLALRLFWLAVWNLPHTFGPAFKASFRCRSVGGLGGCVGFSLFLLPAPVQPACHPSA
jgi:hypothetical protein